MITWVLLPGFSAVAHLVFWYLVANVASQCLVETRRAGALELILSTPLKAGEWLRGQWLALARQLAGPAMLIVISNWIPLLVLHFWRGGAKRISESTVSIGFPIGLSLLMMLADIGAVGWVAMWLALSSKKPGQAAPKTFAAVILLPWLFCSGYPLAFLVNGLVAWTPEFVVATTLVMLVKDWFFLNWARGKLYREFRDVAAVRCSGTPLASRPKPEQDYSEDFALLGSPND